MKLHITIELDNEAFRDGPEIETARILRDLSEKVARSSLEDVNCTRTRDSNGNSVGDVWLVSDDDSDQRHLADMARYMRKFEEVADPDNHDDEAENAAGRLSQSVGYYLAAVDHPDAPAWAKK